MQRLCPCVLAACYLSLSALPAWAQPTLGPVTPNALAPGKTIDLTLTGAKLDDPITIWTSFPAKFYILSDPAAPKKDRAKVECKVVLDASVPVGIGGILVATPEGVSDPLLVVVDDLPSVPDAGTGRSLATAQEVTLPVAIDGAAAAAGSCFYKFTAKAGQRVSVEVLARRLGSPLDPVLWLRDASGREIVMADDDSGLGADCRLSHTIQADGVYVVEMRDNAFAGGGRFRLRIGDFPIVTAPFPLGAKLGAPAKFEFAGSAVQGLVPMDVTVPAAVPAKLLGLGVKYPGGLSSALATVAATALPEMVEAEPNDTPETATKIVLPCGVSGRLAAAKDRDHYQFDAKKGQRFTFKSGARSFGSPTLAFMRLLKVGGGQLAESAVTDSDEESLTFVVPEDGAYLLMVEDLLRRGGPDFVYRVEIDAAPGFALSLKADPGIFRYKYIAAKTGGAFALDIVCVRAGYDGPITLSVEGPAGPLPVMSNVIPDKGVAAKVIVSAPAGLADGQLQLLKVVGKATFEGREVAVTASTSGLHKLKTPQVLFPPTWLDGMVPLAIVPDAEPFYTFVPEQPAGFFPRILGQTQVNIALERKQAEYKDPPLTFVEGLPAGFSAEVKRNGNGPKEQYQVIIRGPKDAPDGMHKIRVVSFGEFKGRGQKTVTPDVPVTVVTPLMVTVAAAGPIVQGQAQKVKVTAARFTQGPGAEKQPITLKWKKLPAGIKPVPDATIPADKDDLEIELSALPDAKEGKFDELIVTAATKFQGQDLSVDSPAGSLEIKKP